MIQLFWTMLETVWGGDFLVMFQVFSLEILANKPIYLAEFISAPYFTLNSSDFDEIFEAFWALNIETIALDNA